MPQAFLVNAWRFSLTAKDGCPWDQIAKYGKFVKDGEEVEFTDLTLSQMLVDFGSRKNDLSADYDHQALMVAENGQPAPAVCFYDSMILVSDGKQLGFATHTAGITAPDVTNWADGLYARRSEMTDLGRKLIGSYKWISPAFTTAGADEQGNPAGYQLLNVAWTNIPFLDGMEPLSFHRFSDKPLKKLGASFMNEDMRKSLGLADDASPEECSAALTARLKKYDDDAAEMKKKFDDMENDFKAKLAKFEDGDGDDDDKKKMDDADDADAMDDTDAMDDDADAMKKMKKSLGLTSRAKMSKVFAAFEAKFVPMSELATLQKELETIKLEREEEKKIVKTNTVETFVAEAIKMGRYPSDKADKLKKLAEKDMEVAKDALFDAGSFHATKRFTSGGRPIALADSLPSIELGAQESKTGLPEIDAEGSQEAAKIAAERKISFSDALMAVAKEKPHLFARRFKP